MSTMAYDKFYVNRHCQPIKNNETTTVFRIFCHKKHPPVPFPFETTQADLFYRTYRLTKYSSYQTRNV